MTKSNDELKACPFCGNKYPTINFHAGSNFVHCLECHATSRTGEHAEIKAAWNTRPTVTRTNSAVSTIIGTLQNWLNYDIGIRNKEGIATTDDTHIMCPPTWPSHGQLREWIKTLGSFTSGIVTTTDGDAQKCLEEARSDLTEGHYLTIRAALQSTSKQETKMNPTIQVDDYVVDAQSVRNLIEQRDVAEKKLAVMPDDVTVSREVLKGVREILEFIASGCLVPPDGGEPCLADAMIEAKRGLKALATLDAVFSEGE